MNAAVRFVFNLTGNKRKLSITPYLKKLHFLPVKVRIDFKIALLAFKCLNGLAPKYLQDLIKLKQPNDSLRSSTDIFTLAFPAMEKLEYRRRKFSIAAPTVWNKLPMNLRNLTSIDKFKKQLKTFYFSNYYDE